MTDIVRYCEDCCVKLTFSVDDYGSSPIRIDCACGATWTLEYDEWTVEDSNGHVEEYFSWDLERVADD